MVIQSDNVGAISLLNFGRVGFGKFSMSPEPDDVFNCLGHRAGTILSRLDLSSLMRLPVAWNRRRSNAMPSASPGA